MLKRLIPNRILNYFRPVNYVRVKEIESKLKQIESRRAKTTKLLIQHKNSPSEDIKKQIVSNLDESIDQYKDIEHKVDTVVTSSTCTSELEDTMESIQERAENAREQLEDFKEDFKDGEVKIIKGSRPED